MPPKRRGARGRGAATGRERGVTTRRPRGAATARRSSERGRAARGGFVRASELPADYPAGMPQPPGREARAAEEIPDRLQIAFWPWDVDYPLNYDFNMDDALMEIRGMPNGHQFNDFELAEYINERLADYEHAREEMAAEHPDCQDYPDEEQLRNLYRFYPDVNWLQVC